MKMPAEEGVGLPDDTPASNELPTQDDPHGAAKEKKRSKTFNVDEDKLLVSAWLNYKFLGLSLSSDSARNMSV
jgi:hypothetical protein